MRRHHFVLVHGSCHGAWCWYKLAALLESAGHAVTALDMAASGIDPRAIGDVRSIEDYHRPLTDYLLSSNSDERVIIVGHSFGGVGVSLAMEAFPDKVAVAVFAAAMLPSPSFSLGEALSLYHRTNPPGSLLDSKLSDEGPEKSLTSVIFGPKMLSSKLYHNCSPQDLKLANMLVRPSRVYTTEMAEGIQFTEERFGSVPRAYVFCKDDRALTEDIQRMFMEKTSVNVVEEIDGADHMVMLSKPQELFNFLLVVAEKFH